MNKPKKKVDEKLIIPDYRTKTLQQFFVFYFSPNNNSWEMDWLFASVQIQNWIENSNTGEIQHGE
jgi:hypothetical protein